MAARGWRRSARAGSSSTLPTPSGWDFVHCPAWTEHIGVGDGPCVLFMVGSRTGEWNVRYSVSELAARYGASVEREVMSSHEAYGGSFEPSRRARPSYWRKLPWG